MNVNAMKDRFLILTNTRVYRALFDVWSLLKQNVVDARATLSDLFGGFPALRKIDGMQPSTEILPDAAKHKFANIMETNMEDYERGIAERKQALFEDIVSEGAVVVELGIGVGRNLKFMPHGAKVIGVEPNKHMWSFCYARARELGVNVELRDAVAEQLPLADSSVDVVVCTLTLCSVTSPEAVLVEVARVLRPGGMFVFIEHVHAPRSRPFLRILQNVFDPIGRDLRDGCRLTRSTEEVIRNAVFSGIFDRMNVDRFDADFDLPFRTQIAGRVRRTKIALGRI